MRIVLNELGKRYNKEWIFSKLSYEFHAGEAYALLGANGSGKSTLLQVIASNQLASTGTLQYTYLDKNIPVEKLYPFISIASPYLELIEEFTLSEQLHFHAQFKSFYNTLTIQDIIQISGLEKSQNKALKYFSSGMKQRVRLALAVLSNSPFLFLDEPTSNLDKAGIEWYQGLLHTYKQNRIVIVCSNHQQQEYEFCKQHISIEDYK